ncbi:MAG: HAD-IB family hydrolase [Planctomycetes bacterium]|nr:HAD-IB family hydrolase [Planctomycetota bacterium]
MARGRKTNRSGEPPAERAAGGGAAAAFFDVDDTLVRGNTAMLSVRVLRKEGVLTRFALARGTYYGLLHFFNMLNWQKMFEKAVQPWVGKREEEVQAISDRCFEKAVKPRVFVEARDLIRERRKRGDIVCLISSTSPFLVKALQRFLDVPHGVCTGPVVEEGLLTDRLADVICYGHGKLILAKRFAAEHGVDLAKSSFFSDSKSDLPLLEAVGFPHAVNPDPFLRRVAEKRGWPVRYFTRTLKEAGEV